MGTALGNLSREDLLKVISSRDQALVERDEKILPRVPTRHVQAYAVRAEA